MSVRPDVQVSKPDFLKEAFKVSLVHLFTPREHLGSLVIRLFLIEHSRPDVPPGLLKLKAQSRSTRLLHAFHFPRKLGDLSQATSLVMEVETDFLIYRGLVPLYDNHGYLNQDIQLVHLEKVVGAPEGTQSQRDGLVSWLQSFQPSRYLDWVRAQSEFNAYQRDLCRPSTLVGHCDSKFRMLLEESLADSNEFFVRLKLPFWSQGPIRIQNVRRTPKIRPLSVAWFSSIQGIPLTYRDEGSEMPGTVRKSAAREVRPTKAEADQLNRILISPKRGLSEAERHLIYKYRYSLLYRSQGLTKFIRSTDWEDPEMASAAMDLLNEWVSIDIGDALELLSSDFSHLKEIRTFAVRSIRNMPYEDIRLYLAQLVQALRYESWEDVLNTNAQKVDEFAEGSPLVNFVISTARRSWPLTNDLFWFLQTESENEDERKGRIFAYVFQQFISSFDTIEPKSEGQKMKRLLASQVRIRSQLLWASSTVKKCGRRERLEKRNEVLQNCLYSIHLPEPDPTDEFCDSARYLATRSVLLQEVALKPSMDMTLFDVPVSLPTDPKQLFQGISVIDSRVMNSKMYPCVLACVPASAGPVSIGRASNASATFGNRYFKWTMYKLGDDLRQDQLIIQLFRVMDKLLKKHGLHLELTPYQVVATSIQDGFVDFVPNSKNLNAILRENSYDLLQYLQTQFPFRRELEEEDLSISCASIDLDSSSEEGLVDSNSPSHSLSDFIDPELVAFSKSLNVNPRILSNFIKSCAGYAVITFILGIGDRHLDNLLLDGAGRLFHIDFGFILGRDPKPFPPPMKISKEMVDGMGGLNSFGYKYFLSKSCSAFRILRRHAKLIVNLLYLMVDANIADLQYPHSNETIGRVVDKFALHLNDEDAELHFLNLINDSVSAVFPVVIDKLHALYWGNA